MGLAILPSSGLAFAASYSTVFPVHEDPICEGGRWTNGSVHGLDWSDVQATPGSAFGTLSTIGYGDPSAVLTGVWGPDQTVEGTVFCNNPTSAYHQEVELRLRSAIAPHSITGYEVLFRCLDTDSSYVQIVRWNGPLGDFTVLASNSGAPYGLATGDVVRASIAGNVITGFINGVEAISATDATFAAGNPGLGFNYGVGATFTDFGFTSWSAVDSLATSAWGTPGAYGAGSKGASTLSGCAAVVSETTCAFADGVKLTWDPVVGATQYDVYRGSVAGLTDTNGDGLPDGGYGTCQNPLDPDTTDTTFVDTGVPTQQDVGFFYLVAYVSGGFETGLGTTGSGIPRTAAALCP